MKSFNWKVIHDRAQDDASTSKTTPIYQTSSFTFTGLDDLEGFFQPENNRYMYSRYGNPNPDQLARKVSELEGAPAGVATSSGMSAILCGVLSVVRPGESVLIPEDVYGGTYDLFQQFFQEWQVDIHTVSFTDLSEVEKHITEKTALVYTESVTNPLLRVENIEAVVNIAHKHRVPVMVDNTFATPYFSQPYKSGVDLVVHSATKYIGGHSDVTAGVLVGEKALVERAKAKAIQLGMNISPFESWLTVRGLKTLSVRMERQSSNAKAMAEFLNDQSGVNVYYPEYLATHGNGAMVSFELVDRYDIHKFFEQLEWVKIVPTLAGVETTVSYPLKTSHRSLPPQMQKKLGITEGLVRMSVGLEDQMDIMKELRSALKAAEKD
ncbi:trans-sulfuration enzyme family protein [Salicibibacter kimchii]|uniref:homocysteine desulfhydrase n=1 Tax=Salicibibacter kimchii TaxID=2099786 RepID=A0A345C2G3_9BACI|nr:aminotransferase class I/II-fold pyridoxal phosphate-dependent enzyme [Salicibibacter kimchii]AXF57394.1 aminotransferase class I/II-fold pyridoxal phosphate-dependent enzyme [Salicibibacter kimchii]